MKNQEVELKECCVLELQKMRAQLQQISLAKKLLNIIFFANPVTGLTVISSKELADQIIQGSSSLDKVAKQILSKQAEGHALVEHENDHKLFEFWNELSAALK